MSNRSCASSVGCARTTSSTHVASFPNASTAANCVTISCDSFAAFVRRSMSDARTFPTFTEELQRLDVELVREHLHDRVHQVRLRDVVLAVHDLLEHAREDDVAVHLQRHPFELREHEEVFPDEVAELSSLLLASLALPRGATVLHAHPQLIHLREVLKHEVHGVGDAPALALVRTPRVRKQRPAYLRQVRAKKQPVNRLLHALRHLDEIFQDVLRFALLALHVHRRRGDEEV
eukprot:31175-Pelagococcus_subviridis.AAC.4